MNKHFNRLPPLENLAVFEAAARLKSFTRAGDELHLSQAAVSRQIQKLETHLGLALFDRRNKEISLTHAGAVFLKGVIDCLAVIRRSAMEVEHLGSEQITIAASMAMSSYWLMPAILAFQQEHSDIEIKVLATDELVDVRKGTADLAIRYGDGNWPEITAIKLFEEEVFPICSPNYLKKRKIEKINDYLLNCTEI